jgi:hypothetical protein
MPSDVLCNAWNAEAASSTPALALSTCDLQCKGDFPARALTSMSDSPCQLARGHISITPVHYSSFEYQQTYTTDKVTWKSSGNFDETILQEHLSAPQRRVLFREEHWRAADASGACGACTDGACLKMKTVHMTGSGTTFVCADLPYGKKANIFGTQEYLTLTGGQLKSEFSVWAADESFLSRMRRQASLPESQRVCPNGVSSACLANKGALTGRACSFQDRCFSRAAVFGAEYVHANNGAMFVLRGATNSDLTWFVDHACTTMLRDRETYKNTFQFDDSRNSFKLNVPLQCKSCPDSQATSGFDPDTGARRCGDAYSPYVLELALASHTGCDDGIPMFQQVECDLHTVSVRRRPQDRLRCAGCETLLGEDGFARGSHRPFMTDACRTCVDNFRTYNSLVGVSAACGFCDDCRNCSASSTFDAMRADFCRPLDDVAVLALASWRTDPAYPGGRRLGGGDQFKRSEYVPAAPDAEHFRDAAFQQQPCRCNNRHKFAQFCGAYAVRDQDAWMARDGEADRRLSLFTDAGALALFGVRRAGVCQPCLACPLEHFNGLCVSGRAGFCALCRTLASCTATPRPYLEHEHALGCAQTTALSDYECNECPVWAKIGQEHVLLVGCGNENLRRWTPTARAFDGVLVVAECRFEHAPGGAASSECMHGGQALQRQRPFGNYSALMPYCPPGWFFKCADRASSAPWDPECCAKCEECPPEKSKNTATWRKCTGASDFDSQSSNCVDRCENNMYEANNTCLFCTTCKEGEL